MRKKRCLRHTLLNLMGAHLAEDGSRIMDTQSDSPLASAAPFILDLSKEELAARLEEVGEPPFRARQMWRALYREARPTFDAMTNISKALRARLAGKYRIDPLEPVARTRSEEGTTEKTLFRLADGELIEAVLMRYDADGHRRRRRTACISTQAGCALGCAFCATGQQGFARDLTVGEIVGQVLHMIRATRAEDAIGVAEGHFKPGEIAPTGVTNVVLMGMGEPLANYDTTLAAVRVLNDEAGVNIGARHITISTVGLAPEIRRLAGEPLQINLAVSLHAPDDETRSAIVPVNRRYPVPVLMAACREYVERTNRRIFFEYVLLDDRNDTREHAERLASLLDGMLCHVNLIPVNPTSGSAHRRPGSGRTDAFREILRRRGVAATVRMEKGIDIDAGCGQLRARTLSSAAAGAARSSS